MREIIESANQWRTANEQIALATVVRTWGSAPRKAGAKMAITGGAAMAGSVSGGCVEGAVVEAALESVGSTTPQLLEFGVADEDAWTVGLACGGMIDVFVEPFDSALQTTVSDWITNEKAGAIATVIRGDSAVLGRKLILNGESDTLTGTVNDALDAEIAAEARAALRKRKHRRVTLTDETTELFVDVIMPSPTLIMVGGVHIAQGLISLAQTLGFRPIVIDPRRAFGSNDRFPDVELHQLWPRKAFEQLTINASTAIALLTHDPKIDDQALAHVLPSSAFYIGALGSKKTAAKRVKRLQEAGYSAEQIERIHGPIGLKIGSQTPEEIALSIMAEIIQAYRN